MLIEAERMPQSSNALYDWFLKRKVAIDEWWNGLGREQQVSAMVLSSAIVFVCAVMAIATLFYYTFSGPGKKVAAASPARFESTQANAAVASVPPVTSTSDSLSLIQQDFSILNEAAVRTKQTVDENRAMINIHSGRIRSIEESLKDNPGVVKSLNDDMQRLKEVMSKPLVPLIPMSAPLASDQASN